MSGRDEFRMNNLVPLISRNGFEYIWMEKLGGFRKGGYRGYMKTDEFNRGIEELLSLTNTWRIAIMCAEKMWFRCHRRFISDRLVELGYHVHHIIDKKRFYPHNIRKL